MPTRPRRPSIAMLTVALLALVAGCVPVTTPEPGTPTPIATSPSPTGAPTATPTTLMPTPSPTIGGCDPAALAARIASWDGAAGHRIATVALTNAGPTACTVPALWQPQLVDGAGNVLIDGTAPGASAALSMTPGGVLATMVQDSNYCGPDPLPPVTVAFVLPGATGRIVATPLSPTDTSGLPPCLGPGSPAAIEMQPWAPTTL